MQIVIKNNKIFATHEDHIDLTGVYKSATIQNVSLSDYLKMKKDLNKLRKKDEDKKSLIGQSKAILPI